jgi:hypothetical protein
MYVSGLAHVLSISGYHDIVVDRSDQEASRLLIS